jgi:hypothetical protein
VFEATSLLQAAQQFRGTVKYWQGKTLAFHLHLYKGTPSVGIWQDHITTKITAKWLHNAAHFFGLFQYIDTRVYCRMFQVIRWIFLARGFDVSGIRT